MESALYDEKYFVGGGSNYDGYGEDPGWHPTVAVINEYLPKNARMLEVACATGWFVKAARAKQIMCEGIDVSEWAHDNAVVDTTLGTAIDLSDWEDDTFDCVVSFEFLEHVPEEQIDIVLDEMFRVCKPTGIVIARIGMDLEADESWDKYPQYDEEDPTHVLARPRWWWEQKLARWSKPIRGMEAQFNDVFANRDWWGRFYARRAR